VAVINNFRTTLETVFDDDAALGIRSQAARPDFVGHYRPEAGFLGVFNGRTSTELNGDWILRITDFQNTSAPNPAPQVRAFSLQLTSGMSNERDNVVANSRVRGAAAQAGLRAGDVIVNWNGAEAPRRVERWLQEQKAGELLKLRVRREDKEMTIEFRLGEIKETFYQVVEDSHAGEKARHIREGMLRGETSAVLVH